MSLTFRQFSDGFSLVLIFIKRFATNYTGRVCYDRTGTEPRFPVEIWSACARTLNGGDRTNNFAESAHRRLHLLLDVLIQVCGGL